MRRLPPSHWLRAFETAARHMSFTGAARELSVTQSAVSQQVKLLEHHLHAALFRRLPRGLQLTEAGEAYLPVVQDAFERMASRTQELFGPDAAQALTVKVNASFAVLWLARRLPRFRAAQPAIAVRFTHTMWPGEHDVEDYDLSIRYGTGNWPGLRVERLVRETRFPVCAPALCRGRHGLKHPRDLAHHPLIHVLGNEVGWPHWLEAAGVEHVAAEGLLELEASFVAYELAACGGGVVLAHGSLAEGMLRDGRLAVPFGPRVDTREAFHLVSSPRSTRHPGAKAFRQWLLREARGDEASRG